MAREVPRSGPTEYCDRCERATPHATTVVLRTRSPRSDESTSTRVPVRVATCRTCGAKTTRRLDDADGSS